MYLHKHHVQQQLVVLVIFVMVQVQNLNVELVTFVHLDVLQSHHVLLVNGRVQLQLLLLVLALIVLLVSIIHHQLKVLIHVLYVLMATGAFRDLVLPAMIRVVLATIAHLVLKRAAQEEHGQVQLLYQS